MIDVASLTLNRLVVAIETFHFPEPPLSAELREQIFDSMQVAVPNSIRNLYAKLNGARFFTKQDSPFRLLKANELLRTELALLEDPNAKIDGLDLFTLIAYPDCSFFSVDLSGRLPHCMPIVDCYGGTFGKQAQSPIVAMTVEEILQRILQSDGKHFHLNRSFLHYGFV